MRTKIENECWKPIKGYEGRYEVSNKGRVRSHVGKRVRCLSPRIIRNGYQIVDLCTNGECKTMLVHRIVGAAFLCDDGEIPSGLHIDHLNGIRYDNILENLRLVTNSENCRNRHDINELPPEMRDIRERVKMSMREYRQREDVKERLRSYKREYQRRAKNSDTIVP